MKKESGGKAKSGYKTNLRMQSSYGLAGFLLTLLIIYIFTRQLNFGAAIAIGAGNFFAAGYYSGCCK